MKKAVILSGSKQYLVAEKDEIKVDLVKTDKKTVTFEPLLVIDGDKTTVGVPTVSGVAVKATILETDEKQDKVTSIRYKSKKRVHTVRGHRQRQTVIKIDSIA
jgi:large subunit ribosomal protein L21